MAFLRKRQYKSGKKVWVIYYREAGKQKSSVIGQTDKRTATEIFNQFCSNLANDKFGRERIKDITLSQFKEIYLPLAEKEKASRTVEREKQIINPLIRYFNNGNLLLRNISMNDLVNYRLKRLESVSPETVNLEFRHLKAIFNRALYLGYLSGNPFVGIKLLRVPESDLPRFFELNEIVRVRAAFKDDPFADLIEFYLLTGARLKEPLSLTWDDIDTKRNYIVIRSSNTKAGKNRIISFSEDEALKVLLEKRKLRMKDSKYVFGPVDGQPQWSYGWVSRKISEKLTEIGFNWATCHAFRHTYISHLVMVGVPLTTVKEIVGHSSITTTLKYAHLAPQHTKEMVKKRPF